MKQKKTGSKLTKKEQILSKYDFSSSYSLDKAIEIVKDITSVKFDPSFDVAIRLGVNPTKADQMVRGTVSLPNGTGKKIKVLVLCDSSKNSEAESAGADYVGLDDYIEKIKNGWTDFDVMVTQPSIMMKVGKLGRVLGPRGLMPNPKKGTVTDDIGKAVEAVKGGRIDFKVDKYGIVHASVGLASFSLKKLKENIVELYTSIEKLKPSSAKGTYIKSMSVSSTMSKGVFVDNSSITL